MAYIYKITNDINNKSYIGKTNLTIEKRWKQHVSDSKKANIQNRPLYKAIKKYGIEHFHIEEIEQCSSEDSSNREIYWIEYYGTFKNGYNATIGGDGKPYCDYDLVYALYNEGLSMKQISEKLGYDFSTCRYILESFGLTKEERLKHGIATTQKPIVQLDKDTEEVLNIFPSLRAACEYLGKDSSGHIPDVCRGKRKTAYGYKWKYGKTK